MTEPLTKEQVAVLRHDWEIIDAEGVQTDPDGVDICISHEALRAALAESQREVERLRVYEEGARITVNALNDTVEFEQRRVEKLREALGSLAALAEVGSWMQPHALAQVKDLLADDGKGQP